MPWPTQLDVLLRPGEVRVTRRPASAAEPGPGVVQGYPVTSAQIRRSVARERRSARHGAREETAARSVQVVVSDHFVRYALVPWNESLVADAERLAFARLALSEIYGSMAEGWAVTLDQQPAGQASFACAIDRELLQALREVGRRHGVAPHSGERRVGESGSIATALRCASEVFCLASLEPGRLTLAFRNESGWLAVRTRRVNGNPLEALSGVLRQEAAAAGAADGGTLYMIADAAHALPSFSLPNWKVTRLDDGGAGSVVPARTLAHMAAAE